MSGHSHSHLSTSDIWLDLATGTGFAPRAAVKGSAYAFHSGEMTQY